MAVVLSTAICYVPCVSYKLQNICFILLAQHSHAVLQRNILDAMILNTADVKIMAQRYICQFQAGSFQFLPFQKVLTGYK